MHQALYRKWRPQTFSEVCGQEHITSVLKYEVANGKTTHAYLFCGSRGTGKTTCAKILAKAVNCLHPKGADPCGECEACRAIDTGSTTDVLEMDAASNTGVDYIRDIKEAVIYTPAMLKTRVYIIDEVHMLSQSAFNALLKTLEEPPAGVVFILATTETQKIPATILSRCKRFDFRRISVQTIADRLMQIAAAENIDLAEAAALTIGKLAQGGMRDAISLLELCAGEGVAVTYERVAELAGAGGRESVFKVLQAVTAQDYEAIFAVIAEMYASSKEITVFFQELLGTYRDLMVMRHAADPMAYCDLTQAEYDTLKPYAKAFSTERLIAHSKQLEQALLSMQRSGASKRLIAELTLIRLCDPALDPSVDSLVQRISQLEDRILMGGIPMAAPTAPPMQIPDATPVPPADAQESRQVLPADANVGGKAAPAASSQKVLRPLACWQDAVQKFQSVDPMTASILRLVQAFGCKEEPAVYLDVPGSFSAKMLDKDTVKLQLVRVLAALDPQYAALTPAAVVIRTGQKQSADPADPFSEITR